VQEMDLDPSLAFTAQLEVRPGLTAGEGEAWRGALRAAYYEQEKIRNMMDFARQFAAAEDELRERATAAGKPIRTAVIGRTPAGRPGYREATAYMPGNYRVCGVTEKAVTIEGFDRDGWGLDTYVIPRLASGAIYATETT